MLDFLLQFSFKLNISLNLACWKDSIKQISDLVFTSAMEAQESLRKPEKQQVDKSFSCKTEDQKTISNYEMLLCWYFTH